MLSSFLTLLTPDYHNRNWKTVHYCRWITWRDQKFIVRKKTCWTENHVFFLFVLYPIMVPSGPSDPTFTQRATKSRLLSRNVLCCFKNTLLYPPFWNSEFALLWWVDGWMGGWMGGWVVIFYPLRFPLFSSMISSKMCWFQKCEKKVDTPHR